MDQSAYKAFPLFVKKALAIALSFALVVSLAPVSTDIALASQRDGETAALANETSEQPEGNGEQSPDEGTGEQPSIPDPPSEKVELEQTKLTGLITESCLAPTSTMSDTVKISPAYGRTVKLQKKLASGLWRTVSTYTTANTKSASIKLSYPASEWKGRKYTTWRVSIPATQSAAELKSQDILLYTKNRKTLSLSAKSAVLINASTGRVLYAKNMNTRRSQASITKVMTAILAIENNSLTKKVKITRAAARTPWTYAPLTTGDRVNVRNLLYAALLPSSNGSATALAQTTSGSVAKFAKLMNKKATALGMKNTHYVNAHGLTAKNHYSSAYDTALLMSYAMKNKTFAKIVKTKRYTFRNTKGKKRYSLISTNRLLRQSMAGVIGGKTGTTNAAGACFTCAYKYKGQTYISVVLGSKNTNKRFSDTKTLLKYARTYGW